MGGGSGCLPPTTTAQAQRREVGGWQQQAPAATCHRRDQPLLLATAAPPRHSDRWLEVLQSEQSTALELLDAAEAVPLEAMMRAAADLRDAAHRHITFSPKVFIPLTRLCRDSCAYCTFAAPPAAGRRAFMTLEEVLAVARLGAQQGCTEALFTLGERCEGAVPANERGWHLHGNPA